MRNKVIYWAATIWLSLGMAATGIVQVTHTREETARMEHLGYPFYLLTLIGIWKLLGVVMVLVPKFPLIKEWAYAGFCFTMSGAIFSHVASGDAAQDLFGPLLLLLLTVVSWYYRPADRKPVSLIHSL